MSLRKSTKVFYRWVDCKWPLTYQAKSTEGSWELEDLTRWRAEPSRSRCCSAPPEAQPESFRCSWLRFKGCLCETGCAPVTCSRADLCRTVSPWGPCSAIAFATRRATEVEFGWCGFLHSCIWHRSHSNTHPKELSWQPGLDLPQCWSCVCEVAF